MSSTRRIRFALAAAFTVLAPSRGAAAPAPQPYVVNVVLPTTGPAAFLGKSEAEALKILEKTVNASGGIQGRPLSFIVQDDQSSPQAAVQLTTALVTAKVPVMIGSTLAGTCGAQAPLLKNGPVDFCLSPGVHPLPGSFVFSPAPSTLDLGIVTARYYHQRGWKKAAFIFSTDGSGQDGERVIDTAFKQPENRDIAIVGVEHFAPSDLSVAAQLAHVKASGAQVLYVWTSGTPTATVLRDIHDAGIDLPIVTSYSNATYAQMKQYKPFMPKELLFAGLPTMGPNELPNGDLKNVVEGYFRAFRAAGTRPDIGQTTAWDAGSLIVAALRKLGPNATAEQIREYLASLDRWTGATGSFDFRAVPQRGVNWKSSVLMARWDPAKDTWVGVAPLGG